MQCFYSVIKKCTQKCFFDGTVTTNSKSFALKLNNICVGLRLRKHLNSSAKLYKYKIQYVNNDRLKYCCLKFCVHLANKGNQYEFRKHPKAKWLNGGLEPLTSGLLVHCFTN